ncbi:hypothetical protein R6Q57_021920 [Mikania cordata]
MATLVSSYEIIFPASRQIIIVNAQPGERVDNRLIINHSLATIHCINQDVESMLFDDGGLAAYTTHVMEVRPTNLGSVVTMDGSNVLDHGTLVMVASYIMQYESLRAEDDHLVEENIHQQVDGNMQDDDDDDDEVCVICQGEFETGEVCAALECEHGYHKECIEKWLQRKNDCPICRAEVLPFFSKICMFRVGS